MIRVRKKLESSHGTKFKGGKSWRYKKVLNVWNAVESSIKKQNKRISITITKSLMTWTGAV